VTTAGIGTDPHGDRCIVTLASQAWRVLRIGAALVIASCSASEPDPEAVVEAFEQELVLEINGADLKVPLEAMDVWLNEDPDRPESFAIHGDDVSIVGRLPAELRIGYDENWQTLVGRAVPLSSEGGDPRFAVPAVLTVPGVGQYRLLGGSITVEQVGPAWNGQTPLRGRIELRIRAAVGEASLRGTFAVKAMTWG